MPTATPTAFTTQTSLTMQALDALFAANPASSTAEMDQKLLKSESTDFQTSLKQAQKNWQAPATDSPRTSKQSIVHTARQTKTTTGTHENVSTQESPASRSVETQPAATHETQPQAAGQSPSAVEQGNPADGRSQVKDGGAVGAVAPSAAGRTAGTTASAPTAQATLTNGQTKSVTGNTQPIASPEQALKPAPVSAAVPGQVTELSPGQTLGQNQESVPIVAGQTTAAQTTQALASQAAAEFTGTKQTLNGQSGAEFAGTKQTLNGQSAGLPAESSEEQLQTLALKESAGNASKNASGDSAATLLKGTLFSGSQQPATGNAGHERTQLSGAPAPFAGSGTGRAEDGANAMEAQGRVSAQEIASAKSALQLSGAASRNSGTTGLSSSAGSATLAAAGKIETAATLNSTTAASMVNTTVTASTENLTATTGSTGLTTAAGAVDSTATAGKTSAAMRTGLIQQIVQKTTMVLRNGRPEIQIDLKPESLGSLKLNVTTVNHQVQVKIVAQTQVVKEILESGLNQLKLDLFNQKLDVDRFEIIVANEGERGFSDSRSWAGSQRTGGGNPHQDRNADTGDQDPTADPQHASRGFSSISQGRVDYFA